MVTCFACSSPTSKNDTKEPLFSQTQVFVQGEDGYHTYRIPALITTQEGTLLAFCEGRADSISDTGNIDVVLKRSFDNGAT